MDLFTAHFTTKTPVRKYGARGKLIAETIVETPVSMPALTREKAMSYADNANFRIEPYHGKPKASIGSGRDNGVGNGTKRMTMQAQSAAQGRELSRKEPAKPRVNATVEAAKAGQMEAAINV